jgi:hypothetical protein
LLIFIFFYCIDRYKLILLSFLKSGVRDANASVRDTNAFVRDANAFVRDTNAFVRDANAFVRDANEALLSTTPLS